MSKIRHSHKQYDKRKWCGTKHGLNRAKVWPVGHITLASQPCIGAFPKTILYTCLAEAVLKVSNAQRWCKEETWPPGLTCGPHTPNLHPEHHLTPPINTTMLPRQKVWREWGLAPYSAPKFILVEHRERRGLEGRTTSQLVGSPRSSSSAEVFQALVQSSVEAPPEFCEFWQRGDSRVPLVHQDSGLSGYPRHYLRVGELPIIVSHSFTSLMLFVHLHTYSRIGVCLVIYTVPCLRMNRV
jgi:hypothetical protein